MIPLTYNGYEVKLVDDQYMITKDGMKFVPLDEMESLENPEPVDHIQDLVDMGVEVENMQDMSLADNFEVIDGVKWYHPSVKRGNCITSIIPVMTAEINYEEDAGADINVDDLLDSFFTNDIGE
jgi:hypothetical protein